MKLIVFLAVFAVGGYLGFKVLAGTIKTIFLWGIFILFLLFSNYWIRPQLGYPPITLEQLKELKFNRSK